MSRGTWVVDENERVQRACGGRCFGHVELRRRDRLHVCLERALFLDAPAAVFAFFSSFSILAPHPYAYYLLLTSVLTTN